MKALWEKLKGWWGLMYASADLRFWFLLAVSAGLFGWLWLHAH